MESARIHATPAMANVSAHSLQFAWLRGAANSSGTHTRSPKPTIIAVSRRVARKRGKIRQNGNGR